MGFLLFRCDFELGVEWRGFGNCDVQFCACLVSIVCIVNMSCRSGSNLQCASSVSDMALFELHSLANFLCNTVIAKTPFWV